VGREGKNKGRGRYGMGGKREVREGKDQPLLFGQIEPCNKHVKANEDVTTSLTYP